MNIRKIIDCYSFCQRGNFGVVAGVTTLLVLMASGIAIDFSGQTSAKNSLQSSLDAGLLAATSIETTDTNERKAFGQEVFLKNISQKTDIISPSISIAISSSGEYDGTASGIYTPIFMKAFGYHSLPISVKASTISVSSSAELVMVLDYSSSMNGQYEAMRDAAIDLVEDISGNKTRTDIEFGLVPFAEEVYLSLDGKYVVGQPHGVTWTGCTMSRKWPWVKSDKTPQGTENSRWGHDGDDCDEYVSNQLVVRPLTNNHSGTISQLQQMTPHSGTNTAVAAEIAYQMISPNLPFSASAYNGDKNKFLIILSDGEQNQPSYGPGGIFTSNQAKLNLQSVCDGVKSNNVTVITITYETHSASAINAMKKCATSSQHYFNGDEGNISEQFRKLSNLVKSGLRLTK